MTKAVALLSGGMDSTVALAIALDSIPPTDVLALSVLYGQKHAVEVEAAQEVSHHYEVTHNVVELPPVFGMWGGKEDSTVLAGGPPQPHFTYKEIATAEGPSPTVVPYRNGVLLSIAATVAAQVGANWIYAGMHAEDARNWAYPDCTPEFIGAMANAIRVGTYDKVRLVTPLQWAMKADVVAIGLKLSVPFHLTHSCYDGKKPACGRCPTCIERLQAFEANDIEDPIAYEV